MIDVESSTGTSPVPVIASGLGRAPASMTTTGALTCRVPPSVRATSTVLGPVKRARPSIRSSPSCARRLSPGECVSLTVSRAIATRRPAGGDGEVRAFGAQPPVILDGITSVDPSHALCRYNQLAVCQATSDLECGKLGRRCGPLSRWLPSRAQVRQSWVPFRRHPVQSHLTHPQRRRVDLRTGFLAWPMAGQPAMRRHREHSQACPGHARA